MIHRSPATSFSCMATHCSRGVAISPGCQKILSNSITGSPVISPKRLARVDLPDGSRPRMTTRFIVSQFTQIAVWCGPTPQIALDFSYRCDTISLGLFCAIPLKGCHSCFLGIPVVFRLSYLDSTLMKSRQNVPGMGQMTPVTPFRINTYRRFVSVDGSVDILDTSGAGRGRQGGAVGVF